MGIDAEVAQTAVRFSFDTTITAAELQEAAAAVRTAVGSVRPSAPPDPALPYHLMLFRDPQRDVI